MRVLQLRAHSAVNRQNAQHGAVRLLVWLRSQVQRAIDVHVRRIVLVRHLEQSHGYEAPGSEIQPGPAPEPKLYSAPALPAAEGVVSALRTTPAPSGIAFVYTWLPTGCKRRKQEKQEHRTAGAP